MGMNTSGEIEIQADPTAILAIIADFPTYPEWSSAHKKASVEETDAEGRPVLVRMVMSMVGITDEQLVEYTWTDQERVSWTLVESTQQRSQEGSYDLVPTAVGTNVIFEVDVEIKIPVPGFLLNRAKKSALETATKGLKKRVESLN
ncbi:MAG: SRPBCC family protein [Mycobacteriaceae bacterium]|jgi:ribosome-associated toxin RatA of RatAB toxin-antitoxin module